MKTPAQRKADERERKRALGLVKLELWISADAAEKLAQQGNRAEVAKVIIEKACARADLSV